MVVLIFRFVVNWPKSKYCNEEKKQKLQCGSNAIRDEVPDPLEDASSNKNAVHDGGQSRLCQHNISSSSSRIGGALRTSMSEMR